MHTLKTDLIDTTLGERRKNLLVLAPLMTESLFPLVIRFDTVAITDMNCRGTGQLCAEDV